MLFDTQRHQIHLYRRNWRKPELGYNAYLCVKYWNSDESKAKRLFKLLTKSGRYDKLKIHKGCVYTSRKLLTRNFK